MNTANGAEKPTDAQSLSLDSLSLPDFLTPAGTAAAASATPVGTSSALPAGSSQPAMLPIHTLGRMQDAMTHVTVHAPPAAYAPAPMPSSDQMPVAPISNFIPVLPMDAPDDTVPQLVPAASNHPLDGDHRGLTRAVILLHDVSRDASGLFMKVADMAGAENETTLIIAPQFLTETDIVRAGNALPDHGAMFARWPINAWWDGGDSVAMMGQRPISSFTVLDLLLLYFSDKTSFPDLRDIVVAGFGAGGDYAQRYAAIGQAVDIVEGENMPVRFVVAAPASYLYFTGTRFGGKNGLVAPDAAQCQGFNGYPYGLEKLNAYAARVGGNAIKLRYPSRHILYLSGGAVPVFDPFPDTSCAALLQGDNRPARAAAYETYLGITFGDTAKRMQSFVTDPKAGYDAQQLLGSSCGLAALFADGVCAPLLLKDQENR